MPADEPDEPTGAVRGRRPPGRHRTDRPDAAPRTPEVGFPAVHRPGQRPPDRPRHARGGDRYTARGGSSGGGAAWDDPAWNGAARNDAAPDDAAWNDPTWDDAPWTGEQPRSDRLGDEQLWDDRRGDDRPGGGDDHDRGLTRVRRDAAPPPGSRIQDADPYAGPLPADPQPAPPGRSTARRAVPDRYAAPSGDQADGSYAADPHPAEPFAAEPQPAPPGRSAFRRTAPDSHAAESYGQADRDRPRDEPHGAALFSPDPHAAEQQPPPPGRTPDDRAAERYATAPGRDQPGDSRADGAYSGEPPGRSTSRGAGRYEAYADDPYRDQPADPGDVDPYALERPGRPASRRGTPDRSAGPTGEDPVEAYPADPFRDRSAVAHDGDPYGAPQSASPGRSTPRRATSADQADHAAEGHPHRDRPRDDDVYGEELFAADPHPTEQRPAPPHRNAGDRADEGYATAPYRDGPRIPRDDDPYAAEAEPVPPGRTAFRRADPSGDPADEGYRPDVPREDDRVPGGERGAAPPGRGRPGPPAGPVLPALPDRRPGDPPGAPAELFVETTAETPALTPELLSRHANSLKRQAPADEPAPEPAQPERKRVLGVPLPALPGWAGRLLPGAQAGQDAHGHGHGHGPARPAGRRVRILIAALLVPCALATLAGLALLWPTGGPPATAQPIGQDLVHAQVTATRIADCSGGDGSGGCVALVVHMADGPRADRDLVQMVPIEPSTPEFVVGDQVVLAWSGADPDEPGSYQVVDFQRDVPLAWLAGLFAAAVLVLGRWRGLAALAALGLSFVVLLFFVVPAILAGRDPLSVAVVGACLIMFAVLYLTHGPSARTSTAVLGTLLSLALIGALGAGFSAAADLTGLDDQTTNLIATLGTGVDARGLLLAGVVIGALGVLDDVTVTQTSAVWELRYANPELGARSLFTSAMRIGRDHVASAVNTLVLAYAGAALPLLLLFSLSGRGFGDVVTSQEVATEIVRTLVGSIGLVASVPITTALAAAVASREAVRPASA
ncbi:hypothetical protein GCM10009559_11070 [Pseudonocardia zijingensis]|uniref:YibE/F-like protein n=1 Tax=Pseudonocardia zijingensis TaxID=153376 RepID=A0ABN1PCD6_9PSEU